MQPAKLSWRDNQPYSETFDDVYFSRSGGREETEYVFLAQNDLPRRWINVKKFVIAETGFGTGLNFLVTVDAWLKISQLDACLHFVSVENFPLLRDDLAQVLACWPEYASLAAELLAAWPSAISGFHVIELLAGRVRLLLLFGDAATLLRQLECQQDAKVDAWFLDGFTPAKNPDMWSEQVLLAIAQCSAVNATFSTYTAAGEVRRGLEQVGFSVEKVAGFAAKRDMLRGQFTAAPLLKNAAPWFCGAPVLLTERRVAVIGAGIAGLTTAQALLASGWQVDLYDAHPDVAQAASGNPVGVLLPRITATDSAEGEFYATAFLLAIRQLNRLKKTHTDLLWQASGVLQLLSRDRMQQQYEDAPWLQDYVQSVSATVASELCGFNLDRDALYFPQAGWLSPQALCHCLFSELSGKINTFLGVNVKQIRHENDAWILTTADDVLNVRYGALVLANAHAVVNFDPCAWLDVLPARGQITFLPETECSHALTMPLCYDGYVLPSHQGVHVAGASFETANARDDVLLEDHEQNIGRLKQYFPQLFADDRALDMTKLVGRAAVRAVTPDRMPMVGAVPDLNFYRSNYADLQKGRLATNYPQAQYLPGLYVNTGHGARGLTSAWLAAQILAAMMNGDVLPVSRRVNQALHPARFFIRQSKKGKLT